MFRAAMLGSGRRVSGADVVDVLERDCPLPTVLPSGATLDERLASRLEQGAAGARELAHARGVSRSHLQRALSSLVSAGRVEKVHRGSATRYRLAGAAPSGEIDARWGIALTVAEREGRVTRRGLAELLGVSERTASRVLKAMLGEGLVRPDGRGGRHAGYVAPVRPDGSSDRLPASCASSSASSSPSSSASR